MDIEKETIIKNRNGFIAALDQSGGSSSKTLELYGINNSEYSSEEEMFNLIHDFRKRVITSKSFNKDKIIGVILFEQTMKRKIDNKYTAEYIWKEKQIVPFLKIDKGLEEEKNGVSLMKDISNLDEILKEAKTYGIYGTKMRSVIYNNNEIGIRELIDQQFKLARVIFKNGLVPIIEPEIDIKSIDKKECEITLKKEIDKQLALLDNDIKVIFKFSIPEIDNFYIDYTNHKNVLKVVALSGGYSKEEACKLLANNHNLVASFSRALLQDLRKNQTDEEFDNTLSDAIDDIYKASIT